MTKRPYCAICGGKNDADTGKCTNKDCSRSK
jgi:hypothetical protein